MRVCAWDLVYAAVRTLSTIFCHEEETHYSTETNEDIEDAYEKRPISQESIHEIEIKCPDEPPVDRSKSDEEIGNAAEWAFH